MDPIEFFAKLGYSLDTEEDERGVFWVNLVHGQQVVARRYGRGDTESAAKRRAMERWRQEQIG